MRLFLRLLFAATVCSFLFVSFLVAQQDAPRKETTSPGALGPAESLTGSIMMINAEKKILVIKSAAGVPYTFVVTPSTRITAQNQRLKLADLASRQDQRVTVRFVPTRRGNLARSVEVTP